jgi:hypothetical protein
MSRNPSRLKWPMRWPSACRIPSSPCKTRRRSFAGGQPARAADLLLAEASARFPEIPPLGLEETKEEGCVSLKRRSRCSACLVDVITDPLPSLPAWRPWSSGQGSHAGYEPPLEGGRMATNITRAEPRHPMKHPSPIAPGKRPFLRPRQSRQHWQTILTARAASIPRHRTALCVRQGTAKNSRRTRMCDALVPHGRG